MAGKREDKREEGRKGQRERDGAEGGGNDWVGKSLGTRERKEEIKYSLSKTVFIHMKTRVLSAFIQPLCWLFCF